MIKIADSNRVELEFAVQDTGIGIPRDDLERIFSTFQQGDSSPTREYGGTGLGLTISKKLVEGMGGQISVSSEPERGSRFSFRCHFETMTAAVSHPPPSLSLNGLDVMILDKNQATCHMLGETISNWGGVVDPLEPGEDPLLKIKGAQCDGSELVVLIDAQLPEMADYELLRQIRSQSVLVYKIMVLLSTRIVPEKIAALKSLGIDNYAIKPLKRADLKHNFQMMLGIPIVDQKGAEEVETTGKTDEKPSKNILLVDDSEDNRLLIQVYLKKTEHTLTMAENGEEGVSAFKSGQFDLVLMDIHMPVMDGLTAAGEIRQWETAEGRERTRIIALTANAMEEDEQTSLDAGCDSHLTKPISKARLLETIEENPQ